MATLYLKQITLPSGSTYDLWDTDAHTKIEDLQSKITSVMRWIGTTTTPLTDGATTNPITIGGESVTAVAGNVTAYGDSEFIFNGTQWQLFGETGSFGALAFKDTASATYTPQGSVSQPTFSGTSATISASVTPSGSVSIVTGTGTANYKPGGTVSQPTFSGNNVTFSGTMTPSGTVSQPTFSGSNVTFSGTITPSGTVSKPTITVTPTTSSMYEITGVGSLPDLTFSVASENLTIGWSAGSLPTRSSKTVATGISSATSSTPTFTGTSANITTSGKATGTVSQPTFTGTSGNITTSGKATGTVSQPTFTGTNVELKGSFTGSAQTVSTSYKPAGTVTKPTFTGTEATITVS